LEQFCNSHRPHHGIGNARLPHPLPVPIIDAGQIACPGRWRRGRFGGILHEFRQVA
jgi:hypothetical protein